MVLPRWLIKLGFHLLYHQFAWTYDLVAWLVSWGQWAAWRRLALLFLQPGPTLELAYGTGGFFVDLCQHGYHPVGIDVSPYMARLAQRRLQQKQLPPSLCQAAAQKLPFPACYFMNIVATFPTDYIFDPNTLQEIERVLHPQGQLVVVLEGQLRAPYLLQSFLLWLYYITGQPPRPEPIAVPVSFPDSTLQGRWHMIEQHNVAARLLVVKKLS